MIVQKIKRVPRCAALFLAAVLCGLTLCAASRPAQAADWMEPYLEQVVEWGVMRGDSSGNLNPDREITRAEFVTLINRAFGYTETGPNPFSDVLPTDWFAEDITIAYQAGYFNGTTETTASPLNYVPREQAAALLGRSLRLKGAAGMNTNFEDGNQIGTWSRALVQEAADLGIIQGYGDNTFRPTQRITRGQVACFLVRALGTLINEPGEQTAGGVYGNMTINTAGVKLKDTTITGNLYLTGGVGLGNVELENVTVLGKIVLCGAGEAEKGENSVILRNVIADSFEVDSLTDQFLTVRAEGLTDIGATTVRTSSYLEDLTDDGLGLRVITLDGESGTQLQLAGNIKEVIDRTPNSNLQIVQGLAHTVTMDERATGSRLNIDNSASIKDLNLDTGTPVTGTGSIGHLNVNAAGSNVETLPDTITVRPGINSTIKGENMDSTAAAESSEDPRLLSGYPIMRDVAPTTATAVFSTNKRGTVHWAVTALTDGSLSEEQLMNPTANSARILRNGTLNAAASNTELTARVTGLTRDGSYYLSALLVDARGRRSPVKVTAFTTPDDTTPAFAAGYPYTILTTDKENEQVVQLMAMATKDCQMYYALLPNNSTAPTQADLKAAAVTGNLGYGVVDMKKNTPLLVPKVNTSYLQEQTTYSLYLWLNDADNGKSSAITRLQVTTLDKTPPTITSLTHVDSAARTATFTVTLDEPGTLFWAVVKANTQFYASVPGENRVPKPEETIAKIQIENGTNAERKGSVNVAREATEVRFTISGLEAQTHYDLYYVAKDRAGNYNVYTETLTPPMEFSTLDNIPPTVTQEFTHDGTNEGQRNPTPYPDTSINLVFSEMVQGFEYINGVPNKEPFMDYYNAVDTAVGTEAKEAAKDKLAEVLRKYITLWRRPVSGQPEKVPVKGDEGVGDNWVIDYREVTIKPDPEGTGEMILTFPNGTGLQLGSGVTYYFTLENIADTSQAANRMQGNRGVVTLPDFTTIDAQLIFSRGSSSGNVNGNNITFNMNFRLSPVTTQNSSSDTLWDMIIWSNATIAFELYSREIPNGTWTQMGGEGAEMRISTTTQHPTTGLSLSKNLLTPAGAATIDFEQLRHFNPNDREYGIVVTEWNGSREPETWSGEASLTITPVASDYASLENLANKTLSPASYAEHQKGIYAVKEIGVPKEYTVSYPFEDTQPPTFIEGTPTFVPGDTGVEINFMVSRNSCKYFCIITKVGNLTTTLKDGTTINENNWEILPKDGNELEEQGFTNGNATQPSSDSITNGSITGPAYIIRQGNCGRQLQTISIQGELEADSKYIVYFVLQGDSMSSISDTYAFGFRTDVISRPVLRATINNPSATVSSLAKTNVSSDTPRDAIVSYMVINSLAMGQYLERNMADYWDATYAEAAKLSSAQIAAARQTYGNLTLVEAMATQYTANNQNLGSVFDLFTTPTIQEQIASWFQTAQTSGTTILKVGIETENLASNNRWSSTINCNQELSGKSGQYWFVAVGRSPLGSANAFTAARYLTNPDVAHPMVSAINFEYNRGESPSKPTMAEAANQSYSGILTITFDGPLYFADNGTLKQVVDTESNTIGTTGNYIKSSLICTLPSGIELMPAIKDNTPTKCESLSFKITDKYRGAAINFSQYLANSFGQFGDRGLSLSLDIVRESTGLYGAAFVIDTDGWDARK